ncbi:hypothetical protein MHYP_G00122520 [Metynnis hypsauchen]
MQDHLHSFWLIIVKPLYPCAELEEEPRALTPSTAYPTTDPTMEDSVEEQEITAGPEEPSPQPQTFSEPRKDTQISKLSTEGKNQAEKATRSKVDDLKESVLRPHPKGTMVQCCVWRDRTDKSGPTYQIFQETEDGTKVQWKTDFTLHDDVRDPGEVYEALQAGARSR